MQRLLSISMLLAVMMVISLAQTSNSANSYFQRAKLRLAQGDLDGAISDFDAALVFNPRLADAYVNRGVARYQKSDFASAITDFDKAIEINPRLAIAITTAAMRVWQERMLRKRWRITRKQSKSNRITPKRFTIGPTSGKERAI